MVKNMILRKKPLSQLKHIIKNFRSKYEIDNYLHEMDYERDLWYSEQYIYDQLVM